MWYNEIELDKDGNQVNGKPVNEFCNNNWTNDQMRARMTSTDHLRSMYKWLKGDAPVRKKPHDPLDDYPL
jgi:hypothetical protein